MGRMDGGAGPGLETLKGFRKMSGQQRRLGRGRGWFANHESRILEGKREASVDERILWS